MLKILLFLLLTTNLFANTISRENLGFRLIKNKSLDVNIEGICYKLTNNSSTIDYFIPANTTDFHTFLNHTPEEMTHAFCGINCAGSWGACVSGVRTYSVFTPASGGGTECPYTTGYTMTCVP